MRGLLVIIAVVILLAFVGWITFGNDDGEATITLEKERIRQDTQEMLDTGADLIDRAQDRADSATDPDAPVADEVPVTAAPEVENR